MSLKIGLSLDPEIERVLDSRCCGLSTERPMYAGEGMIRWETDSREFVVWTRETEWTPLFNFVQTNPYIVGLIDSVGQDLSEIHRRINDGFPDVYQRLQHIEDNLTEIHQRIDYIDARGRQMKASVEELETMIINNEQRIESFIGRLNVVEEQHNNINNINNSPHDDINNDDDPPLAVF